MVITLLLKAYDSAVCQGHLRKDNVEMSLSLSDILLSLLFLALF